jgi:hypothetical protein
VKTRKAELARPHFVLTRAGKGVLRGTADFQTNRRENVNV